MTGSRDVAVVGMACVLPGAAGLDDYWRNLAQGVDAIRDLPADRWPGSPNLDLPPDHEAHIPCRRGGFIPTPYHFDAARHRVPPNVARDGDPDQFVLLDVLADALLDAGVAPDDPVRAETDLLVGRGGYTSNKMMEVFLRADGFDRLVQYLRRRMPDLGEEAFHGLDRALRDTLPEFDVEGLASSIPNLVASRAANRLDLSGAAFTVDAACASSLIAVEQAVQRLRDGRCRLALAAGINFTHVPSFWYLFTHIHAISTRGDIRPFDKNADGMVVGEGAGAVVLKRLEDAARDGDRVYAVVRGAGSASDGRAAGVLAPSSRGQVRALERAWRDAALDPASLSLLEAHGTGTPVGDATELESLRAFFGPPRGTYGDRWMGSVKSMIGHTMPAAGIASFIKASLALSNKVIPPSLNCDEPLDALRDTVFSVNDRVRPWLQVPSRPRRAGVNAFGFGGINAHVVLEEASPEHVAVRPVRAGLDRPSEVLVFAGSTPEGLGAAIRRTERFLREDEAPYTLTDLAHTLAEEADPRAPHRLALVAERLEGLDARLDALAARVERGDPTSAPGEDVYVSTAPSANGDEPGHVAAVFPGIAFPGLTGEYPGHLLQGCLHFPCVREVFDAHEDRDRHPEDGLPTTFLLAPPRYLPEAERERLLARFAPARADDEVAEGTAAPDERNLSHLGMLVNNHASWRLLGSLGVEVDMLCGQSLGDVSAVLAAGMTSLEDVLSRYWKAQGLGLAYVDAGCIAIVGATESELEPHLAATPDVTIGIHLSPSTLMLGGPVASVTALCAGLREAGILAQRLPFPPVHTERMAPMEGTFFDAVGALHLERRAAVTIYSAALAAPVSGEPDEVEPLLRTIMSRPIRFWQTMRRMYEDGARFFVQIGSGTLAANSRTVLEGEDAVCMAMDVAHRPPLTQLQHLAGNLFALGLPVDVGALLQACAARRLPLAAPRAAPAPPRTAVPLTFYRPPMVAPSEPVVEPASEMPTLPFLGEVIEHEPGRRIETEVRLELDEHAYLADHVFFAAQSGRTLRGRLPVLPLTMGLEMLAETAACLAPGRGLLGFEAVRALRWISFAEADEVALRVRARVLEADEETTVVAAEAYVGEERSLTARVRLGHRYAVGLDFAFRAPADPQPYPIPPRRLYEERTLFHGPRFQALHGIDARGEGSMVGTLQVRPRDTLFASTSRPQLLTDPVVLDAAGQLLGSYFLDGDRYVLPVAVDDIELYGPPPPVGRLLPARVEFDEIDFEARRVSARLEIQDGAGNAWCRIRGWQDVVFRWPARMQACLQRPYGTLLAEERAMGALGDDTAAVAIEAAEVGDIPLDWLAHLFLDEDEYARWRGLEAPQPGRRAWLLGRVAAKDAARAWLARRGVGEPFVEPVAVRVSNDAAGRPVVRLTDASWPVPFVSLSHTEDGAVAVAASVPVGVDLASVAAGARLVRGDFASEAEIERIEAAGGEDADAWTTRLWCAKEAAAKCGGEGLGGRPRAFAAVAAHEDGRITIRPRHGDVDLEVHTTRWKDRIVAATRHASTS